MRRQSRMPGVALAAALLFAAGCGAPEPEPLSGAAAGWNVLVLSVDTLRADRLAAWGYDVRPNSPHLDELVRAGTRFETAMAPRAITWPSLASAMTGLYPTGHGVAQNGYNFPDDVPTLVKLLAPEGYQTGAFLSNMCSANHQGWDTRYCSRSVDGRTTLRALQWSEQIDRERPFLLWAHYFGGHSPYTNGKNRFAEFLDPTYEGPVAAQKGVLDAIMTERKELSETDVEQLDALYDAAVLGTDDTIGDLLRGLREAGLMERTLVVFFSDHGEELYDHHGYLYHACSVYQTGLQVPLAFVAPGLLAADAEIPGTVELIDVLPTVLDLLGIAPPTEQHGRSLVPLLEDPANSRGERPAFSEYDQTRIHTVVAGNWKLVDNPDEHHPICFGGAPADLYPIARAELYDLASDPGETTNLAAEHPERVEALRRLIERRFASLTDRVEEQELPEDLKRELEALGYLAN